MTEPTGGTGRTDRTVAQELARWATELRLADVPEPVRAAALRHLLDGLGTAAAAVRYRAAEPALAVAADLGGPPEASVLRGGPKVGAPAAALANGTLVHALDFDDTHAAGLVHATAPVLPAVLAVGEEAGASGAEVLTAAVVGLETVCRLGAAAPHGFHARGLHATSVCGVFAAALAAARLYGLVPDQVVQALGIAGSQTGGLMEFINTGASTKRLHPGFAAHGGVLAARLAARGATGPASVFEGEYGLYGVLAGRRIDGGTVVAGLGERWELTRITVKPYPVCQLSHAPLDAAAALRPRVAGRAVDEVIVQIHPDAAQFVCGPGRERPASPYAAKFSLPWCLAAMLIDGAVTVATFDDLEREDLASLAARVRHEIADFGGAAADQPGRVSALLADGSRVAADVPRSGGGPEDPGLDDLVRAKALANLGGGPAAGRVAAIVADLAAQPSLAPLMTALTEALTEALTAPAGSGGHGRAVRTVAREVVRAASPTTAPRPRAIRTGEDPMTVHLPAAPGYTGAVAGLRTAGLDVADVVHIVEYVTAAALAGYDGVTAARERFLGGRAVPVATVPVAALLDAAEPYAVELTAYPGGGEPVEAHPDTGFHRGSLMIAGDVVYLPGIAPCDAGGLVHPGDFRAQYRYCLDRAADLLKAAGLGPGALVRTVDYTTTATRAEYPRCGRPRREVLGGTGTDGVAVFPGAAGILVDQPLLPGALVSLQAIASRAPLRTVNPGWRRYESLTYKPGLAAGEMLFMSGFGALEPATQKAIFAGDLLAQAEFTYAGVAAVLREAGLDGRDVTHLIEYVTPEGVAGYPELAGLRERYFGRAPVSAVVCSALLRPEFLIEVVPVAALR
ncbi:MmgE/PrpD family protein [Microtetraspora malaysiensis]|uniref:MmgE/PrpD family protein n=1 Tax=Microtetraspora malaysiensis TaxID=161358 RepID=A0ABW6T0I9_9ACTN